MDKLSYTFELDGKVHGFEIAIDKLDKADKTISQVDRKLMALQAHLRELKKPGEIIKLEREIASFGKLDDQVDKTKERTKGLFGNMFLADLASAAVQKLTGKVIELGKEALNSAAKAERLELSFELTMGTDSAEELLGWIDQIAKHTEFTDDALKGWALQFANAGIKGEQLKDTVAAVLDVAGKRGAGAAEGAVEALTRATLTGKIEGRALRGLGIPVAQLAELEKFKGLTEKQINKRLDDVEVTKEDLLNLIAGPDKLLGDAGLKASQTFEARMHHLTDLPDQFFEGLSKTKAFDKMNHSVERLLVKLDPDSPTGRKISKFLETAFTGAAEVVDKISSAVESIDFESLATTVRDDVVPALKEVVSWIKPTVDAVERITRGFHTMAAIPGLVSGEQGKHTADAANKLLFGKTRAEFDEEGIFSRFGTGVSSGFKHLTGMVKAIGGDAGDGLAKGLEASVPKVDAAARDLLTKGAIEPARDEVGAHSPARKFMELGKDIGDGFMIGFRRQQHELDEMMRGAFAPPSVSAVGMGRGQVSLSFETHVTVGATGDPKSDGEVAAEAFVSAVRGPILQFLEEQGLEGGG
jgi:hypothetical protein